MVVGAGGFCSAEALNVQPPAHHAEPNSADNVMNDKYYAYFFFVLVLTSWLLPPTSESSGVRRLVARIRWQPAVPSPSPYSSNELFFLLTLLPSQIGSLPPAWLLHAPPLRSVVGGQRGDSGDSGGGRQRMHSKAPIMRNLHATHRPASASSARWLMSGSVPN